MECAVPHHTATVAAVYRLYSASGASAASPSKSQLPFAKSVKRGAQGGENLGMASSPG